MTEDEQEAESNRYSSRVMKILPLDSGRIAVLGPRNELFRIVDTWEEAKYLGPEIYGVYTPRQYIVRDKTTPEERWVITPWNDVEI